VTALELWPYVALVLVGFLPNEIWRALGLLLARGLNEDSEIVVWSRAVATAILAGVIAKLILFPSGALTNIPLFVRVAAAVCGFGLSLPYGARPSPALRSAKPFYYWAALCLPARSFRLDRGSKFFGLLGQDLRLFFFAGWRFQRNAGLARYDMNMQVEDNLTSGALVELL
jgi:hypothetical protein